MEFIERIVKERCGEELRLLDVQKASTLAIERGIDASCVIQVVEEINKMLEKKFKSRADRF